MRKCHQHSKFGTGLLFCGSFFLAVNANANVCGLDGEPQEVAKRINDKLLYNGFIPSTCPTASLPDQYQVCFGPREQHVMIQATRHPPIFLIILQSRATHSAVNQLEKALRSLSTEAAFSAAARGIFQAWETESRQPQAYRESWGGSQCLLARNTTEDEVSILFKP